MSDFMGLATVYGLLCQDGRIINKGAFDWQDNQTVPLVWRHGHKDMNNVIGHAILSVNENPPGMKALGVFNNTPQGKNAKLLVKNRDIRHLSIWANDVDEEPLSDGKRSVKKGTIREISLVLAGANPGAVITDFIRHDVDGTFEQDGILIHTSEEGIIEFVEDDIVTHAVEDDIVTHAVEDLVDAEAVEDNVDSKEEDMTEEELEYDEFLEDAADELNSIFNEFRDFTESGFQKIMEEFLADSSISHFGIKGMKWGVRRTQAQLGKAALRKKKARDEEARVTNGAYRSGLKQFALANVGMADFQKEGRASAIAGLKQKGLKVKNKFLERSAKKHDDAADMLKQTADDFDYYAKAAESGQAVSIRGKLRERSIKSFQKDHDEMIKAAEELESQTEGLGKSRHALSLKMQANTLREGAGALKEMGKEWESYQKADLAKAAKKLRASQQEYITASKQSRDTATQIRGDISKNKQRIDELEKKKIKQEDWDYPTSDDIQHEVEPDTTISDIIASLNEDQRQLFEILIHSADSGEKIPPTQPNGDGSGLTVQEVFDTLTEEQQKVLYFVVGELRHEDTDAPMGEEDVVVAQEGYVLENKNLEGQKTEMETTHNIFDGSVEKGQNGQAVISHEQVKGILLAAQSTRAQSLRELFHENGIDGTVISHSITNPENMFPDAQNVADGGPQFYSRPMEWVEAVLGACNTRPFSRIKSQYADLTAADARAKGFVAGNQKAEEVVPVLKRVTTPQTIYKLQKLDRDDLLDITDFDVVMWLKNEMRMMLREELARAILISDGRNGVGNDAILETNVRPIYNDNAVYTVSQIYNDVGNEQALSAFTAAEVVDLIDFIAASLQDYRGKGSPIFYCQPEVLTKLLLVRDSQNRRIHPTKAALAEALRVKDIVDVPPMSAMARSGDVDPAGLPAGTYNISTLGVIVNLQDYVIGADRGGQTSFFDDFDLNYNQHQYLYETRVSGALVNPKSAIAIELVTAKTA